MFENIINNISNHLKGIVFYVASLIVTYIYFPIVNCIFSFDICNSDDSDDDFLKKLIDKSNEHYSDDSNEHSSDSFETEIEKITFRNSVVSIID